MKKPNPLKASIHEKQQISTLQKRISAECPERGHAPPLNQKVSFRSLPISDATLRGLEEGDGKNKKDVGNKKGKKNSRGNASNKKQFLIMTDIQNACIPHALRGRDILGAARTGRLVSIEDLCSYYTSQLLYLYSYTLNSMAS